MFLDSLISVRIFDEPLRRHPQLCVGISRKNFGMPEDHEWRVAKNLRDSEFFLESYIRTWLRLLSNLRGDFRSKIRLGEKLKFDLRILDNIVSGQPKNFDCWLTFLEAHSVSICEWCVWDVWLKIFESACERFCVWKIWRVGECPCSLPDWECARDVWEIGLSTRSAEGATNDAR